MNIWRVRGKLEWQERENSIIVAKVCQTDGKDIFKKLKRSFYEKLKNEV